MYALVRAKHCQKSVNISNLLSVKWLLASLILGNKCIPCLIIQIEYKENFQDEYFVSVERKFKLLTHNCIMYIAIRCNI